MAASLNSKKNTVRSKVYWILITVALILGIPGTIGIYWWISSSVTTRVKIPILLLAIPIFIFIGLANLIDGWIVKNHPHMVPEGKRHLLPGQPGPAAQAGYGAFQTPPTPAQGYGAPGAGSQQPSPQPPAQGYGGATGAGAPGYGQTSGYGTPGGQGYGPPSPGQGQRIPPAGQA